MIAAALVSKILATTAVTNLIDDRIYAAYDRLENKVYPLAVYKVEEVSTLNCNDGPTGNISGDFQIACIGESYSDADALATALLTALDGASGTWAGLQVQGVFLKENGISDDILTEPQTEEILYFIKELNFTVMA